MIYSILLENFLAHKRTEVLLGPGMTVLTGANNCGKSAVVEGLRCVSQNPAPKHFIRHGAKEARVTVTVDDGTKITWVRKKKTVVYEILRPGDLEPIKLRKVRKGTVPEEVLDVLRLDPVELTAGSPKKVDVHIGNQRTPIFLLGDDGADARMAEFFASSTEGAHLIAMQKLLMQRIREAKTSSTTIQRSMTRLAQDLDQLAPLPYLELGLARASELDEAVNRSNEALPRLEGVIGETKRLESAATKLKRRGTILATLADPPAVHDTMGLEQVAEGLATMGGRIDRGRQYLDALGPLAEPPVTQSTSDIVDTVYLLNQLTSQINTCSKRSIVLAGLQDSPALFDEQPLAGLTQEIELVRVRLEQLGKVRQAQEANLARLETDIRQRTEEIGNCPLCNSKLDPDAFIGGTS